MKLYTRPGRAVPFQPRRIVVDREDVRIGIAFAVGCALALAVVTLGMGG